MFSIESEAVGLLRAYLPESLGRSLRSSTLTLDESSFIDPQLRATESDLLFALKRDSGEPAWLYVLLEHQSSVQPWLRLRLLRYYCRIWERTRQRCRDEPELRPILPVVQSGSTPVVAWHRVLGVVCRGGARVAWGAALRAGADRPVGGGARGGAGRVERAASRNLL